VTSVPPRSLTIYRAGGSRHSSDVLAAFRYALRRFLAFSEQAARQAGVTPQQYLALLAVLGFPARAGAGTPLLEEAIRARQKAYPEPLSGIGTSAYQ
jgi:hypothetical protein